MRVLKYYVEKKHYMRHENKGNENKVLYCKVFKMWNNQKQQKVDFPYVNLLPMGDFNKNFD